jgi:hypothetical protein
MTQGELALACCYERTLFYGTIPVKVVQMPFPRSKSHAVVVRSALNPRGRQWRADFEELSAIPRRQELAN